MAYGTERQIIIFYFFFLMAGHIFADYFLQLTRLAGDKRKNILALAAHALTWASVLSLILIIAGIFLPWKFCFLFISHSLIDWLKIRLISPPLALLHPVNVTDQLLHLSTILIVLFYG
ncbi:MAG: DUF3307 domain-containing protein [Eubacteriales bacterium]